MIDRLAELKGKDEERFLDHDGEPSHSVAGWVLEGKMKSNIGWQVSAELHCLLHYL